MAKPFSLKLQPSLPRPKAGGRFVIVPDYDITIAQSMYGGCDVWLNNPIRPREACGTSGEKAALSGGLNCSILDGWWADWFVEGIGWAIPTSSNTDPDQRDDAEAQAMNAQILTSVLPLFADQDAGGRPCKPCSLILDPS